MRTFILVLIVLVLGSVHVGPVTGPGATYAGPATDAVDQEVVVRQVTPKRAPVPKLPPSIVDDKVCQVAGSRAVIYIHAADRMMVIKVDGKVRATVRFDQHDHVIAGWVGDREVPVQEFLTKYPDPCDFGK